MKRFTRLNIRTVRPLVFLAALAAVLSTAGFAAAGSTAARPRPPLDGAIFPTPTPTVTLIPTLAPTNTSTSVPLDSLIPTATSIPYPFPTFDSNLVDGGESQTQPDSGASSPSLLVLALPFLCGISLLVGIVVYWMRNARTSA